MSSRKREIIAEDVIGSAIGIYAAVRQLEAFMSPDRIAVMSAADRLAEVTEAIADVDGELLRAIGLLSAEIKPGLDINPEALAEARDLVIEARRNVHGIKGNLTEAGVLGAAKETA